MKIIITESQYDRLLSELPPFLKRRVTMEDLEWMDGKLNEFMSNTPAVSKFEKMMKLTQIMTQLMG